MGKTDTNAPADESPGPDGPAEDRSSSPSLEVTGFSENGIAALVAGLFEDGERTPVETHRDPRPATAPRVDATGHDAIAPVSRQPQRSPALADGRVLAERFTIWRFVAHGVLGDVFEALDRMGPERVAIETVPLPDDPNAARRLHDAVMRSHRITHRHVCRIHALHEHREAPPNGALVRFLAMEFVDGDTLAARLARGPMPAGVAGRVARQLLEGLSVAHAAGVLHLDFRSQNVMLRAGVSPPEAVIMNLGMAPALRSLGGETRRLPGRGSNDGALAGSLGYLSPEQLERGGALGPASDLYSFGVVLFEMLTGRLPFRGERTGARLALQRERPAPVPSQVSPGLTPVFDAFVARCLARDPAARFADAASALSALDRCLARRLDGRRRRVRQIVRALALIIPLGLGLLLTPRGRPRPAPKTQTVAMPQDAGPETPPADASAAPLLPSPSLGRPQQAPTQPD